MQKILVVSAFGSADRSYYRPFAIFGEFTTNQWLLNEREHQDICLVVFTGGEDISPSLYGEKTNRRTFFDRERDTYETKIFKQAVKLRKNIVGICRGAQLICAMSGGKLVQQITGHLWNHTLRTDDNRLISVASSHHQMQLPPKNAVPVAWAEPRLSECYLGGPDQTLKPKEEYDVVWYPSNNALGLQYHPEYMRSDSEGFLYSQELIKRFFNLTAVLQ